MGVVDARGLIKTYGEGDARVEALKGVDFEIHQAEFVAFAGPSGSGKTTVLNLVGCLDRPTDGSLLVAGMDITGMSPRDRARFRGDNIGFVFQNFNLIAVLTAFENVEYPLCMVQSLPSDERRKRVMGLLEAVGMVEHKDRRPDQLSGGQKQRVAVARALVTHPKLVLADEPTANLDRDTSRSIIKLMKEMREQTGTAFVFSTHDGRLLEEVDKIFQLEDGRLNGHMRPSSVHH